MPGLGTPPLPEGALPGGILLAEQQVLSPSPRSQHSHIGDFVSHPNPRDQRSAQRVRCIALLTALNRYRSRHHNGALMTRGTRMTYHERLNQSAGTVAMRAGEVGEIQV